MRSVYTNLSPISNTYSIIHHLFYLKNNVHADRVYLCIWDTFVYEHQLFLKRLDPHKSKQEMLEENVLFLEKIMDALDLDYKIIYFSEAWSRMFKKPVIARTFSRVLSKITFKDIKEKSSFQYTFFDDVTLAKMNYIIADYIIATYFHEIFPEFTSSTLHYYLTGERFKTFARTVTSTITEEDPIIELPIITFVLDFPFLLNPQTNISPSVGMSDYTIKEIVAAHCVNKLLGDREVRDFLNVLSDVIPPGGFVIAQHGAAKEEVVEHVIEYPAQMAAVLTENLVLYFGLIKELIKKDKDSNISKTLFVSDAKSFDEHVKPLNTLKLAILSLCDGKKTSFEIASLLDIPLPTVSVYFGRLRRLGLINAGKRPKRIVKNIVIDLDGIDAAALIQKLKSES